MAWHAFVTKKSRRLHCCCRSPQQHRTPSVAEAVNAAHQHVASNPSDDHFDAAKEGLSRAFCEFFERANQAEAMQMASLHMLALYTLRRKLRREVDDCDRIPIGKLPTP